MTGRECRDHDTKQRDCHGDDDQEMRVQADECIGRQE